MPGIEKAGVIVDERADEKAVAYHRGCAIHSVQAAAALEGATNPTLLSHVTAEGLDISYCMGFI